MIDMPNLRSALDDLYGALVETPKNETKVKTKFNAVRDKLLDEYKNRDGTLTGRNAEKFRILQAVIAMLIVACDPEERQGFVVAYGVRIINRNRRHFVGKQAAVVMFLQKVAQNINDTKFFENIQLDAWEVDDDGGLSIEQCNHSHLLLLRSALAQGSRALNNIEETDAERALNNFEWRRFAGGREVVPTDAEKHAARVFGRNIDPQHSTDLSYSSNGRTSTTDSPQNSDGIHSQSGSETSYG